MIGALSVNQVSSAGKVNVSYGLNFLAHLHSFEKTNASNFHIGDASVQRIISPINDRDVMDTAIMQIKAL
jgi:hypothetical protein